MSPAKKCHSFSAGSNDDGRTAAGFTYALRLASGVTTMDAPIHSEAQPPASRLGKAYRRDIDGLRAIAILSVVAYHVGIPAVGGGFVGVDVFFVISGYLITSIIYTDIDNGTFSVARFYGRRAKRILPALFSVLLVCYVLASILLSPAELRTFANDALATILSSSNVMFWLKSGYFSANAELRPLLMTWSLGAEEQFYLFFPILMLLLGRFGKRRRTVTIVLLLLTSFAVSVWGTRSYPTATFFLLPTRAWELAVGALIAIWEADKASRPKLAGPWSVNALSMLAAGLLVIAIAFYSRNTMFPGLAATLPVAGSALLIMTPSSWVNRIVLSSRPMVFVGLVSYSWYLWHWPLLSFARILAQRTSLWIAGTVALISFLLAVASHRCIEQPLRKTSTSYKSVLQRYCALSLCMALPLVFIQYSNGWPARFPGLSEIEATGQALKMDSCLAGYGKIMPNLSAECAPTITSDLPGVALLGDSHAAALAGALRLLGSNSKFRLFELTKASCPALVGITRLIPAHPGHDRECASFNKRTLDQIQWDGNIQVVILAGFWSAPFVHENEGDRFIVAGRTGRSVSPAESRQNFKRGLEDTVKLLQSSGKRVIVLKDNPIFSFDPVLRVRETFIRPRTYLANLLDPARPLYRYSEPKTDFDPSYDNEVSAIIDSVGASNQAVTFDLKNTLCDETSCYFYDGKSLLYEDAQHLSVAGAERGLDRLEVTKPVSL
jgi:peptidoglycan/LPS O-acetylase OafA/YrhL